MFDIKKAREKLGDSPDNFCECCGEPIYAVSVKFWSIFFKADTEYWLWSEPKDLAALGMGFSLFYNYTKKLIILVALLSVAVSLPCLLLAQKEYNANK